MSDTQVWIGVEDESGEGLTMKRKATPTELAETLRDTGYLVISPGPSTERASEHNTRIWVCRKDRQVVPEWAAKHGDDWNEPQCYLNDDTRRKGHDECGFYIPSTREELVSYTNMVALGERLEWEESLGVIYWCLTHTSEGVSDQCTLSAVEEVTGRCKMIEVALIPIKKSRDV